MADSYSIAEVAVFLNLEQTLDYRIPAELRAKVSIGQRVRVPVRDQPGVEGFIIGLKERSQVGPLREISALLSSETELDERDLMLARWMAQYYLAPLGIVLQMMAPGRSARTPRTVQYAQPSAPLSELVRQIEKLSPRAPQQAALLKALLSLQNPTVLELLQRVGCGPGPLRALVDAKLVQITKKPKPRIEYVELHKPITLNAEQQSALAAITQALYPALSPACGHPSPGLTGEGPGVRVFLLYGVNGSGKTEVYLRTAQRCVAIGGQAIVLVPEISLTPQLIARFRNCFGDQIAVYHSGLTEAERARQWQRIKVGEAQIAIGVRAAIFAPFNKLRLIIVDEEHESTYKQDDPAPRYHLRDVALKRAELSGATVVLGSATPSIESYFQAEQSRYRLLAMSARVVPSAAPTVQIVELSEKNLLNPLLRAKIEQRLQAGEQVMLLLNRLGYSAALCRRCRQTISCPQCKISLTFFLKGQALRCRYCNYEQRWPRCRNCGARELLFIGAGTERLELELRRTFPKTSIRRMDSESVRRGEHAAILEAFRQGQIQILLGTQMIGLGLDFPNVTLVGIVSADTLLDFPDFRAGEQTFQLISQAAGRAGRGAREGEVIIQTRHPDHPTIQLAAQQNYRAFYELELEARRALRYPPFAKLISVTVEHNHETRARADAQRLAEHLWEQERDLETLGPAPAVPYRWRGRYRWHLLLKNVDESVKERLRGALKALQLTDSVSLNVDPQL